MNTLLRREFRSDGIFSDFYLFGDTEPFMRTLEHAFPMTDIRGDAVYLPIIPNGIYKCVRGIHKLHDGIPFETFEITGIAGHSGLLFHRGNFNKDSEGCVLTGQEEITQANGEKMITGSKGIFIAFMKMNKGINEFQLEVR